MNPAPVGRPPRTVTICGTFNLALAEVAEAVDFFHSAGVAVISPSDPTFAEVVSGFTYVASDRHRDPSLVERRHLQAVAESDFVWLVAPGGYVGLSGAMEVAYASGRGVQVFTADDVREPAVRALVSRVSSSRHALDIVTRKPESAVGGPRLIVEPEEAAEKMHAAVDAIASELTRQRPRRVNDVTAAASDVRRALAGL